MFCFLDILSASCAPSSDQITISPIPVLTHPVPPSSVSICPLVGKVHQLEHQASTVPQHTFPSETSPSSFTCLCFSFYHLLSCEFMVWMARIRQLLTALCCPEKPKTSAGLMKLQGWILLPINTKQRRLHQCSSASLNQLTIPAVALNGSLDSVQKGGKWPIFRFTLQLAELSNVSQAFLVCNTGLKGELSVLFSSTIQK